VLIRDGGRPGWHADWDGTVHTADDAADRALTGARAAGYEAVLTSLVADGPTQPDGEGDPR
jgi:hypothetical protein